MSLFGNLFDENGNDCDEDDESSNELVSTVAGGSVSCSGVKLDDNTGLPVPVKPPDVRPEHGLCGIMNRGATCYLNSLLQVKLYVTRVTTIGYWAQY